MPRSLVPALSLMLVALVAVVPPAHGQSASASSRTVSGIVVDAATGAPIADAVVATLTGEPVVTDPRGQFVLAGVTRSAVLTLLVVAPGYGERTVRVRGDSARIELTAAAAGEVIELEDTAPDLGRPATWEMEVDQIRTLPGAGNDALKAAQSLPGVARIPFGMGGLVVRGMSPRDTNVYLDGIEVPLAFHFFGITSFYPSTMLAGLEIANGGYGVEHGRGQGGLVTLTSRAPRRVGWRAGGEISLVDASARAEGPTGAGGAISLGVRRSYIDGVLRAALPEEDRFLPRYYDAQIRWDAGDAKGGGELGLWLFTSNDRMADRWDSFTESFVRLGARYRLQRGATTFALTPWAGRDVLSFEEYAESSERGNESELSRTSWPVGLRASVTHDRRWGHVAAGLDAQGARHGRLAYGTLEEPDVVGPAQTRDERWSADVALWAETRVRIDGDRLAIKPGLRVEHYGLTDEWVVDPRLLVAQQLGKGLTLRHAIGLYHQPPTASDTDAGLGNPELDSAFTLQGSTGFEVDGPAGVTLGVTAFASRGWHQPVAVEPPLGSSFHDDGPGSGLGAVLRELLEEQLGSFEYRDDVGGARAFGVELGARRSTERFMGWLSYTLTKSRRRDDPARFSGWRPYALDQLHNVSVVGTVRVGTWQLGARLRWVTGNPYTPTLGEEVDPVEGNVLVVGAPLSRRLPDYVQLDVRADHSWKRDWGTINLYLDVQNATWRDNVEDIAWDDDRHRETRTTGLPIIPMIGVEYVPRP